MIYWFSGCGNSRYIAKSIADATGESLQNIASSLRSSAIVHKDAVLGLVFPVYSWAPPKIVANFIKHLLIEQSPIYTFVAVTCGDNTGLTETIIRRLLRRSGVALNAFFSFQMPETYINLPGFNLDTPQSENKKIEQVNRELPQVVELIERRTYGNFDNLRGSYPMLKSYLLSPLFNLFLITDRPFRTENQCTGCGCCAQNCPMHNIKIVNSRPKWGGNCTNCMSCYHRCPTNAVQFGNQTKGKGQYFFGRKTNT